MGKIRPGDLAGRRRVLEGAATTLGDDLSRRIGHHGTNGMAAGMKRFPRKLKHTAPRRYGVGPSDHHADCGIATEFGPDNYGDSAAPDRSC